jgi:ABC-type antimicrobial peptide transport system permease subunit
VTALRFALKDMLHELSRTILCITGLAVVIASYFILSSLAEVFNSLLNTTTVNRNLIITQNDMIDPSDATIEPQVMQAAQELVPGSISRISPLVFRHIRVGGHVVQLRAAEVEDWESIYHLRLLKGTWPRNDQEVVVGEGIALANNWEEGTEVEIFGSSFRISGIFRAQGTAFASVWMPSQTFWGLFDTQRGYQFLVIQAAKDEDPEAVRLKLQNDARLKDQYAVYFEDNYTRQNIQSHIDLRSMMTVVSWITLLGVIFGIFNATTLNSVERARELGILLGIGFSHRSVRNFLLIRSTLLGGMAYLTGLAVAILYVEIQHSFAPIYILGLPIDMKITPGMAAAGLAWVAGLAYIGAWISTHNLFKLRVIELVRVA